MEAELDAFLRTGMTDGRAAERYWKAWQEFCQGRIPPLDPLLPGQVTREERVAAAAFVMKHHHELGWDSNKVGVVVARIKEAIAVRGGNPAVWAEVIVRLARKACELTTEQLREKGRDQRSRARFPLTYDFLDVLRPDYWGDVRTGWDKAAMIDKRMAYVAIELGIDRIFRACNLAAAAKGRKDHAIRAADLVFIFGEGEEVREVLTLGETRKRQAGRAGLMGLCITCWTGKTNKGRPEDGVSGGTGKYARQLQKDMWHFCTKAGGAEDGLVFERYAADTGMVKKLTPKMVGAAIKEAAVRLRLDPVNFGNHSLRIAGAGMMEALQEYLSSIEARGSWAPGSRTVREVYTRLARKNAARGPLVAMDGASAGQRERMITPRTLKVAGAVRKAAWRKGAAAV